MIMRYTNLLFTYLLTYLLVSDYAVEINVAQLPCQVRWNMLVLNSTALVLALRPVARDAVKIPVSLVWSESYAVWSIYCWLISTLSRSVWCGQGTVQFGLFIAG